MERVDKFSARVKESLSLSSCQTPDGRNRALEQRQPLWGDRSGVSASSHAQGEAKQKRTNDGKPAGEQDSHSKENNDPSHQRPGRDGL